MAYTSPISIVMRGTRVEIERNSDGAILAYCPIGDDDTVERIADILSAKRLPREAAALRKLRDEARKVRRIA